MMEFGKSLRAAREAKGYTVLQLADMTHMAPSVVENLEKAGYVGGARKIDLSSEMAAARRLLGL